MTVHYEYPVHLLPKDLRDGLPADGHVNITIESTDRGLPGFTKSEVDNLLGRIDLDRDGGTVIETREDGQRFFDGVKARAKERHEQSEREETLLRKLG